MYASDVRSIRITAGGALSLGRARLGAIVATTTAGGTRLTLTDGDGGATKFDIDLAASDTHHITLPGDGILFESDPFVSSATNVTGVTFFFM